MIRERLERVSELFKLHPKVLSLSLAWLVISSALVMFPPANADTVKVTFVITKIIQPFSSDIDGTPGDFYANVNIADIGVESSDTEDCSVGIVSCVGYTFPYEVGVNFKFTRDVDLSEGTIPIRISLVDSDFLVNPDDFLDINPEAGKFGLLINYDLNTGTWSGDVPDNQGFSSGPISGYDENGTATIFFEIAVDYDGDIDGDGIPNGVELFGIRDASGDVIQNTNGFGFPMDPCRKTVAVEIDYMDLPGFHTHRPLDSAMQDAVDMFNNAPVDATPDCPYSGFPTQASGMNLVIDVDDALDHETDTKWQDEFESMWSSHFTEARRPYFIYNAWVHALEGKGSTSGISDNYGGFGFVVSLGLWTPLNGDQSQQFGTFVHELGHSLGLDHGGDDPGNCKPNYLSVMNYNFSPGVQFRVPNPAGGTMYENRIDYSRVLLQPSLNESALNENVGIGAAGTYYANAVTEWDSNGLSPWRNGAPQTTSEGALDWNGNGSIEVGSVQADLDDFASRWITDCIDNGLFVVPSDGFDDWSYLDSIVPASGSSGASDITFEQYQRLVEDRTESASMDLRVVKSADFANALPGDTLTYTVLIENIGSGPATSIVLEDTFPDATSETRNLDEIEPGSSITEIFTFEVPFSSSGKTISNRATVTGHDLLGNPDKDAANNLSQASTVIANFCDSPISRYTKVIVGTSGDDTLTGGNGRNLILGLAGNDVIKGGNAEDCLIGGSGNDIIYGLNGKDLIAGNNGNDVLYGGDGNDVLAGGAGTDSIEGQNGDDRIDGNNDNDNITGGSGNDLIDGGNGNDTCAGNAGKNSITNCSP
jgi:uncharacterized repeat protein (TIGR01451 family)